MIKFFTYGLLQQLAQDFIFNDICQSRIENNAVLLKSYGKLNDFRYFFMARDGVIEDEIKIKAPDILNGFHIFGERMPGTFFDSRDGPFPVRLIRTRFAGRGYRENCLCVSS